MNTIIVDDDAFFCTLIKGFCEKSKLNVKAVFHNPIEALFYMNENPVDLVFLDVHMPDINGFDFLKSSPKTKVILTTNDETKAVEAFDYDVVDFLLKPVTFNRFLRAIQRVRKIAAPSPPPPPAPTVLKKDASSKKEVSSNENEEHIYVNINKRLIKVMFDDVEFIQAKGNYVLISRNKDENLIVHTTLKKISQSLPSSIFMKVQRSYIINTKKIVDIEDNSIVIGRNVIPI